MGLVPSTMLLNKQECPGHRALPADALSDAARHAMVGGTTLPQRRGSHNVVAGGAAAPSGTLSRRGSVPEMSRNCRSVGSAPPCYSYNTGAGGQAFLFEAYHDRIDNDESGADTMSTTANAGGNPRTSPLHSRRTQGGWTQASMLDIPVRGSISTASTLTSSSAAPSGSPPRVARPKGGLRHFDSAPAAHAALRHVDGSSSVSPRGMQSSLVADSSLLGGRIGAPSTLSRQWSMSSADSSSGGNSSSNGGSNASASSCAADGCSSPESSSALASSLCAGRPPLNPASTAARVQHLRTARLRTATSFSTASTVGSAPSSTVSAGSSLSVYVSQQGGAASPSPTSPTIATNLLLQQQQHQQYKAMLSPDAPAAAATSPSSSGHACKHCGGDDVSSSSSPQRCSCMDAALATAAAGQAVEVE